MSRNGPSGIDTDDELIERVLSGEHDAFYELVKPCEHAIYVFAFLTLRNDADAQEVIQEALLKAFKGIACFRREAKFSTWLTQIVINEARMRLRKYRPSSFCSLQDMPAPRVEKLLVDQLRGAGGGPSCSIESQELRRTLQTALSALPPKYRTVLLLREIREMTTRQAALALGVSEPVVKTRLLRARLMMRATLWPYRLRKPLQSKRTGAS